MNTVSDSDSEDRGRPNWTPRSLRMLVRLYYDRRERVLDRKSKKVPIWRELLREMTKAGYKGLSAAAIERKLRQMKTTYNKIKQQQRSGSNWEFFQTFDKMFGAAYARMHQRPPKVFSLDAPNPNTAMVQSASHTDASNILWPQAVEAALQSNGGLAYKLQEIDDEWRTEAIERLAEKIDEANKIQIERNAILKQFLNKFK